MKQQNSMRTHLSYLAISCMAACCLSAPLPCKAATEVPDTLFLPINLETVRAVSSSSARTYSGDVLGKYPTLDLMNSFTGVIPGLFVTENTGATGLRYHTPNATLFMRGHTDMTYIIDDVILSEPLELQLNPDDIESVTLVSDILDKARFGPEAARGAIYIRTRRGLSKGRQIAVNVEKGVEFIDRMPKWVSGVEYANLNNLARSNAGYPVNYTEEDLTLYGTSNELDLLHPIVNYKDLMLRDFRNFNKVSMQVRGGGENVRYSAALGWVNNDDIYKLGSTSDYNRFNARMNLNVRINPRLTADFSFLALYTLRRSPLTSGTVTNAYEFPSIYSLVTDVPAIAYPLYLDQDEESGENNWVVSSQYPNNPYASLAKRGSYTETGRTGITKARLTYDLSALVPQLKSETQISFNVFHSTRIGQKEDYLGVIYDPVNELRTPTSHLGTKDTDKSQFSAGYLQNLQFHEKVYHDWTKGPHEIHSSLTYYRSRMAYSMGDSYHNQQNLVANASYSYGGKYLIELVGNYAGTSALKKGHRYEMFPSAGLAWVVSQEPFLKDSRALTFLKLRAQAGILGYDTYESQYYWQSQYTKGGGYTFGPYTTNQWFGSTASITTNSTTIARYANDNLGWEKNKEYSVGLDAEFFERLDIAFTYYDRLRDGVVANVSAIQPGYFGPGTLMDNYNIFRYWGEELNISWRGGAGDFRYRIGTSFMHDQVKNVRVNAVYSDKWQDRNGKIGSYIWGMECLGKFASAEEIADSPVQTYDANVQVGDLKYLDFNNDDVIDTHDVHVIGDNNPKLKYAVNLQLVYKGLELTVVGTGKAFFDLMLSNKYFWNGWGDGNYSAFVRDNLGEAYPRLSYEKSTNNFINSDFWMRNGSFFKIQNVELAYSIPQRLTRRIGASGIRFFARGANLLTLSGIKDIDPESPDSGVTDYPLFRTVTGGFTFTF